MESTDKIIRQIEELARGRFDALLTQQFIEKFSTLVVGEPVIDYVLQISLDEGDELEIGFFTDKSIGDVTLSRGEIYSCVVALASVKKIEIQDLETKWVLKISGEKKFDYNVLKPNPIEILHAYEQSLRSHLSI